MLSLSLLFPQLLFILSRLQSKQRGAIITIDSANQSDAPWIIYKPNFLT